MGNLNSLKLIYGRVAECKDAGSNPAAPTNFGKQQTKRRKQMNTKPNPKRKQKGFIILYFAVVALITYGAAAVAVMESINQ